MDAKAGFFALAVSAALVMASGAMASNDAMAQADDVTAQGDAAPVETDEAAAQPDAAPVENDVAAAQADEAPVYNDVAATQDEVVERPVPKQKPSVVERPVKSDLKRSAARVAPVTSSPRPTRTSTRAIALPKILGSYR